MNCSLAGQRLERICLKDYKDLTEGHPLGGPVNMDKNYGGPREIRSSPYLLPTGTLRNQAKFYLFQLLQKEHALNRGK